METLFENKYIRDEDWAKDSYSYLYFRRPIIIALHLVFLLYLIIGIYNSITTKSFDWYFILLPVFWCVLIAFLYNRSVKTIIKRDLKMNGKPIEVTVTVTEERLEQTHSAGAGYNLNYEDIKKVVQTEKYIYLWSKTSLFYSLKKDAFSSGNAEEFLMFLKSKGIKL